MAERSADYKLGYQSGRNSRDRVKWATEQRHQAEVLAVAERAERAEKAAGLGHCEDCKHWSRPRPEYAWGYCTAPTSPGTPFGCWAQAEDASTYCAVRVSTSPHFGCVLFLSRADGVQGTPAPTRWCPECRSAGVVGIEQDVCPTCDGTGKVPAGVDLPDGGQRGI